MAQKTNLNVSPYFDDFASGAKDKNYYKVLFNPGRPIQARELNTLQSILQDQVETFGSHIFKEGSLVIPGNIVFDNQFNAVKLNLQQYGVDITSYLNNFIGKKITGQISGVTGTIQYVQLPNSDVEYPTIYVKYLNSDVNFKINPFQNNEPLYASETIGNIVAGTPFATTTLLNSTSIGSAASIGEGVYFIRGTFVRVPKQTIILDYYTNSPSYRIGLRVDEQIITPKDDSSLYDNAKGFTNYAAPGADRFKISLTLTKKLLTDFNDTDFVELLRVKNGTIQKIEVKTSYSLIKDYLAQRTYDESGNYVVSPFKFSVNNSLNDRLGNDGIFFSDQKTEQGNTPSDDLMCIKLSPGKAYVKGYDIEKTGVEIIDVPKPRTTKSVSSVNIPFEMGNLLRINNVSGSPKQREIVYLQNRRKNSTIVSAGTTIGYARVYNFNLTDSAYNNSATNWDLYLYDIQTYTELTLNQSVSTSEVPKSSFIKGKSSGASGYVVFDGSGSSTITLSQTSGSFISGEQIQINGLENPPRTIRSIKVYGANEIKSVYQPTSISGFTTAFVSDSFLNIIPRQEIITISAVSGGVSTATVSSPSSFNGIKENDIIRYQYPGAVDEVYNRVTSISEQLTSLTLEAVSNVTGVCTGSLPLSTFSGNYSLGVARISNEENGSLYAQIPYSNISFVDLNSSSITFSAQSNSGFNPTISSNSLTVNTGNFNLGINSTSARFETFDEERYSIIYSDGTVEKITSDKFSLDTGSNQVTFSNIQNKTVSVVNATFVKNSIQSKNKKFNRSKIINVNLSKNQQSGTGISTSINDGLTYNKFYGLRVQDEEICLRYPDVAKIIAIYESLDTNQPVLDKISFNSSANVGGNSIVGENIIGQSSNAIARVVNIFSSDTLEIVYLNRNKFTAGEQVLFEESNLNTSISSITLGKYSNITNKFTLDKGQKDQYYDYAKIIRKNGESSPSKQLLIIFDYYSVPSEDSGDVFTVNSYPEDRFTTDIPSIGKQSIRATDTLDFRPIVSPFNNTTKSPFDFDSRSFGSDPKLIMSPSESSLINCNFYLGRIDKLYLDKLGNFSVNQGIPSINPKEPVNPNDVMEIATIDIPPYLYDTKQISISLTDNTRYTMRDIGKIEDRVENLERVTSLSLLELNTQSLQIQDAQGFNRFKTGFFVDDFKNDSLINTNLSTVEIDTVNNELTVEVSRNSINLKPVPAEDASDESIDLTSNFALLDANVQKTGDVITLKYESVDWIEQTFATQVENVNPFHVVSYIGTVLLNPESDSWTRTIRLPDVTVVRRIRARRSGTTINTTTNIIGTGEELYMRSRNTGFVGTNLKPLTRFYQFLDGSSGVDFIPKLIEISNDSSLQNYGSVSSFVVGETVTGTFNGETLISFRVANSNHKDGDYNDPDVVYTTNPYVSSESIPEFYSPSSKVLNVDIESLCTESQGLYSGYLTVGMQLVGQTSGAVAYVKDLRLISDVNGFLAGSFFLRDPYTTPPPSVRIETGTKVYTLSSSSTNEIPLPGSSLISSAEATYRSEGTWQEVRNVTTITRRRRRRRRRDPLAQSFSVGATSEPIFGITPDEDENGVYITAVDLFFASKDSGSVPLTVEIRTVELGTPTETVLGNPAILQPEDIEISDDASIATKVTFDYPIYLEAGLSYAIVLLAEQSIEYEVWIAQMGEKTIETRNLPDSQSVRYTRQFAIGRLYKSQNGSEWTPNDYQDMKFKLYKAKFTSKTGSVLLQNPTLNESNGYVPTLAPNSITILPRKLKIGITTTTDNTNIGILTTGRKVSSGSTSYGYIVGTGSSVSTVAITTSGFNYANGIVDTYNITGNGSGLKLNITVSGSLSGVTGVTVNSPGNGYSVGDVVGIVTSSVSNLSGNDARITIQSISGLDTLYLSNVQGNDIPTSSTLIYYDSSNVAQSLTGINVLSSTPVGGVYSGNYFKVNHFNHGMYSDNNKVKLSNVLTDLAPTVLTTTLRTTDSTISVGSTSDFVKFEGVNVSATNPGFLKIGNEIIKYTKVDPGLISELTRGIDSTIPLEYSVNTPVYKYELGGVSLRRINKVHDISDNVEIDSYYLEFDRSNFDTNAKDRSTDTTIPQVSFNNESICGGSNITASENIQFDAITPHCSILNPNSFTSVSGQIRTVSGTSVSGSEQSFIDQQYQSVELGRVNKLSSTRIVCSKVNEDEYLDSLLRNKSFTLKVDLQSSEDNLSPMVFWRECSIELLNSRLNSPIQNYSSDSRVNSILNDPHASIYVSNTVLLSKPATSLKVILSAYRHSTADFRVLYSLIRPDSSEIDQSFELFPGYDNLTIDQNQDGFLDVVDPSKNSGLPDRFVPASLENQFLDYEFSVNNLGSFSGYTIKIVMSGTNQAYAPRFKDLRSIALA